MDPPMTGQPMGGDPMWEQPGATAVATFAGGCFWCMEEAFDQVDGVISTTSGFTGGSVPSPTYNQVSSGSTGHAESVRVVYDPAKVGYKDLLYVYWRNIDPTVRDRQFCDAGSQYRAAIFYHDDAQRMAAQESRAALARNKPFAGEIVTQIAPVGTFYAAEEYHQDFHIKNPLRYKYYKFGCGRPNRLRHLWGDEAGGHRGGTHG
ncbi:MAG: peptide-methionine (S)-S-oxide reductase MsrA [Nitrospirae bacterium]|nr:peptide-methionine (S)-S-oxide reductase MsrA [Nitrospirota bacterium]